MEFVGGSCDEFGSQHQSDQPRDIGGNAISVAEDVNPDVVLMHVKMPKMDGITATRRITGMLPGVRVYLLTAYDDQFFRNEAAVAGAAGYLLKGALPADIIQTVLAVSV